MSSRKGLSMPGQSDLKLNEELRQAARANDYEKVKDIISRTEKEKVKDLVNTSYVRGKTPTA